MCEPLAYSPNTPNYGEVDYWQLALINPKYSKSHTSLLLTTEKVTIFQDVGAHQPKTTRNTPVVKQREVYLAVIRGREHTVGSMGRLVKRPYYSFRICTE